MREVAVIVVAVGSERRKVRIIIIGILECRTRAGDVGLAELGRRQIIARVVVPIVPVPPTVTTPPDCWKVSVVVMVVSIVFTFSVPPVM